MFDKLFKKKSNKIPEEITEEEASSKVEEEIVNKDVFVEKKEADKQDFDTEQSISMGLDMKKEVETSSRAFFNSKNSTKAEAYIKFQKFLSSLSYDEKYRITSLEYLDFKDKEIQIFTSLKNGFAQFISKGAHLDEESKKTIDMVFGDIKKLPSKGHRYWYYKIYIWQ